MGIYIAEQLSNREKNIRVHCSLVLIFLNDVKTIISLWQSITRHDETDAALIVQLVINAYM